VVSRAASDWTDLISELLPIIITVVIGLLALTKRLVDGMLRRRADAASRKPMPPLNEEVRQFLEEFERDRRGLFGGGPEDRRRGEREEVEAAAAAAAAEESREREERHIAPAPPPDRPQAAPIRPEPATAWTPERAAITVPLAVERPAAELRRRRMSPVAGLVSRRDLRRAFVWAEILAAPVALRNEGGVLPASGQPLPPPPRTRG